MNKTSTILVIIIIILLFLNIFFGFKFFTTQKQLNNNLSSDETAKKVAIFNKVFVDKVLRSQGEIVYEDRLKLENAAADTNNAQVIDQWHKFLDSQTEQEAQQRVVELLNIMANKISY